MKVKTKEALFTLNKLVVDGHGDSIIIATEEVDNTITFYNIRGFEHHSELNINKIIIKFAFNTHSHPEGILNIPQYCNGTITIKKAYEFLKDLESKGYGDKALGQPGLNAKGYNPIENIYFEDKINVCSLNIKTISVDALDELLNFL
jgi:hypothetical protein